MQRHPIYDEFLVRGDNEINCIRETIDLISSSPADIKLLRQELDSMKAWRGKYFDTIADLRRHLDESFETSFFSRSNKRFFGDTKYKWSKKYQTLTIEREELDNAYYVPYMSEDGAIKLRSV